MTVITQINVGGKLFYLPSREGISKDSNGEGIYFSRRINNQHPEIQAGERHLWNIGRTDWMLIASIYICAVAHGSPLRIGINGYWIDGTPDDTLIPVFISSAPAMAPEATG